MVRPVLAIKFDGREHAVTCELYIHVNIAVKACVLYVHACVHNHNRLR